MYTFAAWRRGSEGLPPYTFAAWRRTPLQLGFVAVGAMLCTSLQLGGVTAVGALLCTSLRLCGCGGLTLYTFATGRHWQWEPSFVHLCSFAAPQWELLLVHPDTWRLQDHKASLMHF